LVPPVRPKYIVGGNTDGIMVAAKDAPQPHPKHVMAGFSEAGVGVYCVDQVIHDRLFVAGECPTG
jgi:hypothetical protein